MVQDATDTDSSFSVNHASARLVLVGDVGHEVADSLNEQASLQIPTQVDELVVGKEVADEDDVDVPARL